MAKNEELYDEYDITVRPYPMGYETKDADNVLRSAAVVFSTWQEISACDLYLRCEGCEHRDSCMARLDFEIALADCIQACCNLAGLYDIDMSAAMDDCEERNRDRWRWMRR